MSTRTMFATAALAIGSSVTLLFGGVTGVASAEPGPPAPPLPIDGLQAPGLTAIQGLGPVIQQAAADPTNAASTLMAAAAVFAGTRQHPPIRGMSRRRSTSSSPTPRLRARCPAPRRTLAVLTDEQVDAALPDLDGWERVNGTLRRAIKFPAFLDGIDAVRRIGEKAEEKDHHPDIDIRWRTVTFVLVTHSEGGITDKDVEMAKEINSIAGQ